MKKIQDLKLLIGDYALSNLLNQTSIYNIGDIHCLPQKRLTNTHQPCLFVAIYVEDNFHGNSYYVYANGICLYKVIDNYDKIDLFLNDLMNEKQLHTEENYYKREN